LYSALFSLGKLLKDKINIGKDGTTCELSVQGKNPPPLFWNRANVKPSHNHNSHQTVPSPSEIKKKTENPSDFKFHQSIDLRSMIL